MHARTHACTHARTHAHTHYSVCQHLSAMPRSGEAVPVLAVCCDERALVTVACGPANTLLLLLLLFLLVRVALKLRSLHLPPLCLCRLAVFLLQINLPPFHSLVQTPVFPSPLRVLVSRQYSNEHQQVTSVSLPSFASHRFLIQTIVSVNRCLWFTQRRP